MGRRIDGDGTTRVRVIPPPLYFLFCLLLGGSLQLLRPVELAGYAFRTGMTIGLVMVAAAGMLGGWALIVMTRAGTPVEPWKIPVHLVTSGPFRLTRNPLYLTLTLVLASIAVMANSAWLTGAAILLAFLLDGLVIRREERVLVSVFGREYTEYTSRVRRWL